MSDLPVFTSFLIDLLHDDREECLAYAISHGYGIEIRDIDWPKVIAQRTARAQAVASYRDLIATVPGPVVIHSPDRDLLPGGTDPQVVAETRQWIAALLDLTEELNVPRVISHTWFDHYAPPPSGIAGWVKRHAAFWRALLEGRSVGVCLENSWGHRPEVLAAEVDAIGLPNVGACLDVGHAHLQGGAPLDRWVEVLGSRLRHLHLHDNDRSADQHYATGNGTVDWPLLLAALRRQGLSLDATLEVERVGDAVASLAYLRALGA